MQFNHPEILALLFLLIIPVLIHLFQLQRFRKEAFTNVKFLRQIQLESRKSSKLKKLLTLAARLLALACLILAFAQPIQKSRQEEETRKTVVYIDNSLSMQAKDKNGAELLQDLKAGIIDGFESKSADFSLITNDRIFDKLDLEGFKRELLDIAYHPVRKEISQVLLEAQNLTRKNDYPAADVFMFSDFRRIQDSGDSLSYKMTDNYYLVPVRSEPTQNLVLDSLWMASSDSKSTDLRARIRSQNISQENLSLSLVLNGQLFGKTSQAVESDKSAMVEFSIPAGIQGSGAMTFTDPRLGFDNTLFFTLPAKINPKVLVIGERSEYLSRIYDSDSFELRFSSIDNLDQGSINDFDLVLINELRSFPAPLTQSLRTFAEELGNLVIIPSPDPDIFSYREMMKALGIGTLSGEFDQGKLITSVNYEHPFFKNVFKREVTNFEYPRVNSGLEVNFYNSSTLLGFEDGTAFIEEVPFGDHTIYWISSSLASENSDFRDSPLIVPVFFNFSLPENKASGLYSLIGRRNELQVDKDSLSENALKLTNGDEEYIPLQKSTSKKVTLITKEYPLSPGIYQVYDGTQLLSEQAFNYDRDLIRTDYQDLQNLAQNRENIRVMSSYKDGIQELNSLFSSRSLWQLFTIFALFFMILEMLIQKFLKI